MNNKTERGWKNLPRTLLTWGATVGHGLENQWTIIRAFDFGRPSKFHPCFHNQLTRQCCTHAHKITLLSSQTLNCKNVPFKVKNTIFSLLDTLGRSVSLFLVFPLWWSGAGSLAGPLVVPGAWSFPPVAGRAGTGAAIARLLAFFNCVPLGGPMSVSGGGAGFWSKTATTFWHP